MVRALSRPGAVSRQSAPTSCCCPLRAPAARILNSRGPRLLHCLRTESRLGGKPLIYGRFSSSNRLARRPERRVQAAQGGTDSMVDVAEAERLDDDASLVVE